MTVMWAEPTTAFHVNGIRYFLTQPILLYSMSTMHRFIPFESANL